MKIQRRDQLVYVHDLNVDEDLYEGIFPKGARDKKALFTTDIVAFPFLIPNHRYLFKKSFDRYPWQFYMEVLSYLLGRLMGITVPPSFVGYDSYTGECGALIEWFYNYPNESQCAYHDGGVYMKQLIDGYDLKYGEQHNFQSITVLMKTLAQLNLLGGSWKKHWLKTFIFDAIIGNTDRHHENWGLVWWSAEDNTRVRISPAFDNGTSMGHEIVEKNFSRILEPERLRKYISDGTHHAKWLKEDTTRTNHAIFVRNYLEKFSGLKDIAYQCLSFDMDQFSTLAYECTKFDIPVPLSVERVDFVCSLIEKRRSLLVEQIGFLK